MHAQIITISVIVAEWQPFGKVNSVCSHCIIYVFLLLSPNFEKHIAFGLPVRPSVRLKKIKARVLKFHIWIPCQK